MPASERALSTERLLEVLNQGLDACRGGRRAVQVRRQPAVYYSSHRLEDLDVRLDDGATLSVISKDLSPGAMLDAAARVKPQFLSDPTREPWAYQLLDAFGIDGPRCVGFYANEPERRYFLFLEKAAGVPLWQVGELGVWQAAVRWSAATHWRLRAIAGAPKLEPLVPYTAEYFALWPTRVTQFLVDRKPADGRVRALGRLLGRYDRVIDRLTRLPRTLIHGEFHASNILVDASGPAPRIIPVDWEMAGFGPGLMDLADLTAGNWTAAQRRSLVDAYREALPPGAAPDDRAGFDAALDACRLHKALQWLGWAPDWQPPKEHCYDWLDEALRLGEKLGLP